MPSELLLFPIGTEHHEFTLDPLRDVVRAQPFAPAWVLLPGRRQEDALRQEMVDRSREQHVYFNISVFSFYTLYARLLDSAGKPQRELDEVGRLRLIRGLLTELQLHNQLTTFQKIADKPGFAQIVADFIYELKQNVIYPEVFEEIASLGTDKDRDLAKIYVAYQATLRRNNLIDREGEGWLALDEVRTQVHIGHDVAYLLVEGFDQFNPLQAKLLALLASRVQRTVITLPHAEGRETTVGRRFVEAQACLISAFEQAGEKLIVRKQSLQTAIPRHAVLTHLTRHLFNHSAPSIATSDDALALIEAPDAKAEAKAIMRHVKRLLLEGHSPESMVIALRDASAYASHLAEAAHRYGIPAVVHHGDRLGNNPAIIAFLNVLNLARNGFRRRDVIDILRSPYFAVEGMTDTLTDHLETISRIYQVISGKQEWLDAIQLAATSMRDEDGEYHHAVLESNEADALLQALMRFFALVTPRETDSVHEYIAWIEQLIGQDPVSNPDDDPQNANAASDSLFIIAQIRHPSNMFVERDLTALQAIKQILRGMQATQKLLGMIELESSESIPWNAFLTDFLRAVGSKQFPNDTNRSGKVLITSATEARGLLHDFVFIPGLSEGVFPSPIPEDPIYLDSERQALANAGVFLETQAERTADDGLFHELVGLPRRALILSRPTIQNGVPWAESHLWRAVRTIVEDSHSIITQYKIPTGGTVKAAEAAHFSEAAVAIASSLNLAEIGQPEVQLYKWLRTYKEQHWLHIVHNRHIEIERMLSHSPTRYSGRLYDKNLLRWVADELGPSHIWSASQFNDYGMCGFRFFAKRLLKLEETKEPETGMDAAQRGTVIHAILENTYRELSQRGISIEPDNVNIAVDILRDVAAQLLPSAPQSYGFSAATLWQQEQVTLMRKVEILVRADFSHEAPIDKLFKRDTRFPYKQEVALGGEEADYLTIRIGNEVIKVSGYIDRIDRIDQRAIVVDYKTGSKAIPTSEMTTGRNFQMMLYLKAGEAVLERERLTNPDAPTSIAGGTFWHLNNSTSGAINLDIEDDTNALAEAQVRLHDHLAQGRAGNFISVPSRNDGGACAHYCEFTQFCRVSIMNRRQRI